MNIEIKNGYLIIPEDDNIRVIKKDVFVEDGILKLEKTFQIFDKIIDAENRIILPGMVNAHHHIYSCLSKGIPAKTPFKDFLGTLENLWWKLDRALDKESILLSTVLTLQDCIRNGVTTVFDHHISANFIENSLDVMADVFTDFGLNGVLCFETSNRNGKDIFLRSLNENIRFLKKNEKSENLKGMIGLHALLTLDDQNLKTINQKAAGLPIHCHIAEDEIDEILSLEKYGKSVIERLEEFDLLRNNSLLIHASNISEKEMEILKNKNIFLVQAIDSNMNNALNIANISTLIKNGIKTTVGTDGMTSNIFKELKNSFLFTKFQNQNPDIGFPEMLSLFLDSFKLKKAFGFPLGVLENEPADLVIFDYIPATPFYENTFWGHFIYGITESQARWVIKGDEILLDDYKLDLPDKFNDLIENRIEISKNLFGRFENIN
ncbi:MAG: amidohydrolase family protein [Candidatus Cloacimonetes bacterium]|nr:amidohydrolase family protein [Candidatus Cloacimonadota bacterium]